MNTHQYLTKVGRFTSHLAGISFGIGTLLFVLHKIFHQTEDIILIGIGFVAIAFAINLLVFLFMCYLFIVHPFYRDYFAGKMFIMLVNIPAAGFYFLLVINNSFIF